MNRLKQRNQEVANKGFNLFIAVMPKVCESFKREFTLKEMDSEELHFEVDNYPFSLTWNTKEQAAIGRMITVVEYQLSIWKTVGGGRWHPPENVDETIASTGSVWECMKEVFKRISVEEISNALESIGQAMEAKEHQEWY
jgi:hypothetical protein